MRKWVVILCLTGIFSCIALLFWYKEWVYNLPTPVPENYSSVRNGQYIDLAGKLHPQKNKPVFLHFFNPDCPCSRFNITHFKSLVKEYGDRISFAVIVMTSNKDYTAGAIGEKFGLSIPVIVDSSLARTCGVYSTPQAVLLDNTQHLYYRGNYNRSRYCTDKKSNYAQMAIDSLLASREVSFFNQYALKAYGCSLPNCKR